MPECDRRTTVKTVGQRPVLVVPGMAIGNIIGIMEGRAPIFFNDRPLKEARLVDTTGRNRLHDLDDTLRYARVLEVDQVIGCRHCNHALILDLCETFV